MITDFAFLCAWGMVKMTISINAHHLRYALACGVGGRFGLTWRYGAIKRGVVKSTIPHHASLKGRILNATLYHARQWLVTL